MIKQFIFICQCFLLINFAEAVEPSLKEVKIGIELKLPLSKRKTIQKYFSEYQVDVHLIKIVLLDDLEVESNVKFNSKKQTKFEGVAIYPINNIFSVGGKLSSDVNRNFDHLVFIKVENLPINQNIVSLFSINTKEKKFHSLVVLLKQNLLEYGIGVYPNQKKFSIILRSSFE